MERVKLKTIKECLEVDPEVWADHVDTFRADALERLRLAVNGGLEERAEHWRLMAHILELDPRDWDGFGLLDRWEGDFEGEP